MNTNQLHVIYTQELRSIYLQISRLEKILRFLFYTC